MCPHARAGNEIDGQSAEVVNSRCARSLAHAGGRGWARQLTAAQRCETVRPYHHASGCIESEHQRCHREPQRWPRTRRRRRRRLRRRSWITVCLCLSVSLCRCVSVSRCLGVSVSRCLGLPVSPSPSLPLSLSFSLPLSSPTDPRGTARARSGPNRIRLARCDGHAQLAKKNVCLSLCMPLCLSLCVSPSRSHLRRCRIQEVCDEGQQGAPFSLDPCFHHRNARWGAHSHVDHSCMQEAVRLTRYRPAAEQVVPLVIFAQKLMEPIPE